MDDTRQQASAGLSGAVLCCLSLVVYQRLDHFGCGFSGSADVASSAAAREPGFTLTRLAPLSMAKPNEPVEARERRTGADAAREA